MRLLAAAGLLVMLGISPAAADDFDPYEIDPAEPNFSVVTLPTQLRPAKGRLAFRLTHRFSRPLGAGSFSDLAADLFGFDGGAQVGLGFRYGLLRDTQLGLYRTSDRTIDLSVQQALMTATSAPLGLSLRISVEGRDNFSEEHSPALCIVASRTLGSRVALYAVPAWVGNTNVDGVGEDDSTVVLGVGARVLLTDAVAILAEAHPRLAGYKGDRGSGDAATLVTLGIERRVGGHVFQLNVSNDLGTTQAQVARGQQGARDWFIGFNLSRRFY